MVERVMHIENYLCIIANQLKFNFTLDNKKISNKDAFSKKGVLPAIANRADQKANLCCGHSLGIVFDKDESAKLGMSVSFDEQMPEPLILVFLFDIIMDLTESYAGESSIPLDELLYE